MTHHYPKLLLLFITSLLFNFTAGAQGMIYQNKFDGAGAGPYSNPYIFAPGVLDSHLSNSEWTLNTGTWTSYNGNGGNYALATNSAAPVTKTLDLSFNVASQEALTISGFSFYNRSSSTGYSKWDLLVNNIDVASGNIFVDVLNGSAPMQNTGTITLSSPVGNLAGIVHVDLVLSGGTHGSSATFRFDEFTLFGSVSAFTGGGNNSNGSTLAGIAAGGATNGVFSVSNIGGAGYSIPIQVPPGFNGVQPGLSLSYNSQGSNGIMGMGWSLSGVSAISRVPNTIYNDKTVEGVSLSNNDKFALDGNRLVVVSGAYGANASQYHTENESFNTIIASGTLGNGPASFTVTGENGWISEYGATTNSLLQVSGNTTPYMWLLDKVTDLNGNVMTYQYTQYGNGEVVLSQINYESNTVTGLDFQGYIGFQYVSRTDPQISYIGGGPVESTVKLSSISCYQKSGSAWRTVRQYTLNYTDDIYTHLTSVTESGQDNVQILNPTQFSYGGTAAYADYTHHELIQQAADIDETFAVGDYNGDGKADLIQFSNQNNNDGYTLFLNTGAGNTFTQAETGSLNFEPNFVNNKNNLPVIEGQPFDYDGDGKDDFFYQQTDGAATQLQDHQYLQANQKPWIYLSTGTGIVPTLEIVPGTSTTIPISDIFSGEYPLIGDFDGDGKSEILEIASSQGLSTGEQPYSYLIGKEYNTQTTTYGKPNPVLLPYTFDNITHPFLPFKADDGAQFFAIDYNGDGKTDILQVTSTQAFVWEMNVTFTNGHPVIGTPAFTQVNVTGYPTTWHNTFIGDFNGDHISDVLTYISGAGWEIGYGDGTGLMNHIVPAPNPNMAQPYSNSAGNNMRPIFVGDFNGDGKDDIYDASGGSDWGQPAYAPRIYYSKGSSFVQENPPVDQSEAGVYGDVGNWFGDFNGDGSMTMLTRRITDDPHLFLFHPNETRHLIVSTTSGLGGVTKINYLNLTNASVYAPGTTTYTYPYIKRTMPSTVVSTINTDNGINTEGNNTDYFYTGIKYNVWGKGLMGFDIVKSHDEATNTDNTQNFALNTQYAFPYLQSQVVSQGSMLSQTVNTYRTYDYQNGCIFNFLSQSTSTNNITGAANEITYDYTVPSEAPPGKPSSMDIGKPMRISTDKGSGEEVATQTFSFPDMSGALYTYANASGVTTSNTRAGQPAYTRTTNFVYNPANGQVTSTVTDPGTSNAVTTAVTYDNYGAVIGKTISATALPSIAQTTIYDPTNRFVAKSYNIDYLFVSGQVTYDPVSGNVLSNVAADGLTITDTYDAFGRVVSTTDNNGGSASITYGPIQDFQGIGPSNAVYGIETLPNTATASYKFYDKLGRLVRTAYPAFNSSNGLIYEDVSYNTLGEVASKTKPYFANATPQTITYTYDSYKRLTSEIAPEGTTTYSYALGSVYTVTTTDRAGHQKISRIDASGKTQTTTDNGGALSYTYSSNGQVQQVDMTGANTGTVSTITYDDYGRKIKQVDPNYGGSTAFQYTYNAYGQVVSQQDPHGNTYTYTYDVLGNILTKTGAEGPYTYTYNYGSGPASGKNTQTEAPGNVTHVYTYGMGNQLLSEDRYVNSMHFTTSNTYDSYGRLAELTYPNGKQIQYEYNSNDGSLQAIENATGTTLPLRYECQDKNELGEITSEVQLSPALANINTTYTYDTYGFLKEQQSVNPILGTQYKDLQYSFDPATGNLLRRKDVGYNLQEDFTYDNLNRLTNAQGQITGPNPATLVPLQINYSGNGNITQKSDVGTFSYNQANMVSELHPYTTVPDDEQQVTYTQFNKVATISEGANTAQFTYWADGSRCSMALSQSGTLLKTKYYMPGFEREMDPLTGGRDLCYVTGPNGHIIAILETKNGVDARYYVLTDRQGSITQIIDDNGNVVEEKSFDAWGRARNPQTWAYLPPTGASNGWDRGYTAHELIPQFGIINMNGRLYDPLVGRVFSPDDNVQQPGCTQSYNRYTYCANNPLKYSDPSGEAFVWDDVTVAFFGGLFNVVMNGANIHSFGQGLAYFGVGAASSIAGYYGGPLAAGAIMGAGNKLIDQSFSPTHKINPLDIAKSAVIGAATSQLISGVISAISVPSEGPVIDNLTDDMPSMEPLTPSEPPADGAPVEVAPSTPSTGTTGTTGNIHIGDDGIGYQTDANGKMIPVQQRPDIISVTFNDVTIAAPKTYTVYYGVDPATGTMRYIGITSRELSVRVAEHIRAGGGKELLQYYQVEGATDLSKIDARIWEQSLINANGGVNGTQLLNKINSIAPNYWDGYGIK